MSRLFFVFLALILFWALTAGMLVRPAPYDGYTPVSSMLIALGDEAPEHYIGTFDSEKMGFGKDIVITGSAFLPDKTRSRQISEFYVCVDCHSILPETRFADDIDPESRLSYAIEFNQPYLPGPALYGVTNRTSWFNGNKGRKFGEELIGPARHSLRNAIQLCSKEYSVGRELEDWEMEAIVHYLNALELKMKDLSLSEVELEQVNARGQTDEDKKANIRLLKSKYIHTYLASYVAEKAKEERKMGEEGDVGRGKYIYDKSCMHCHREEGAAKTVFGNKDKQKDADWLVSYFKKDSRGSIYWVTRHGTEPNKNTPQYMPIYSEEKLSDSQIEDLAAYLLAESKKAR